MANSTGSRIDLQNLSKKDIDIMTLDMEKLIKKYKLNKGTVYTRRNSINKRLKAEGLSLEQIMRESIQHEEIKKAPKSKKQVAEKPEENHVRDLAVIEKNVPVILKPIEINFENFSISLNGVPKKISVNPETHAIEIDL